MGRLPFARCANRKKPYELMDDPLPGFIYVYTLVVNRPGFIRNIVLQAGISQDFTSTRLMETHTWDLLYLLILPLSLVRGVKKSTISIRLIAFPCRTPLIP